MVFSHIFLYHFALDKQLSSVLMHCGITPSIAKLEVQTNTM